MSMHDIEDLVEGSIRLAAKSNLPGALLRTYCHNLYEFQDGFDCSFTKLRVFNTLLQCDYFYLFDLKDHPFYPAQKAAFDALSQTDELYVYENVAAGYDNGRGTLSCYWLPTKYLDDDAYDKTVPLNKLCCEAGSKVWRSFVEQGKINGEQAVPPQTMPMPELIAEVAELALATQDTFILVEWFRICPIFFEQYEENPEGFDHLCKVFLSPRCFEAMSAASQASLLLEEQDDDEYGDERLDTWFASFQNWAKTKA